MPNYRATQQRIASDGDAVARSSQQPSIPPLARLLAEFHTSMNLLGVHHFAGNVDRFLVYCLLLRTSLAHPERRGAISIHSAAMSLGRPFETVRRHVGALIDCGACERTPGGIVLSEHYRNQPAHRREQRQAHDCFVRLIADGIAAGLFPAQSELETTRPALALEDGICAAIDLLQALSDTNRALCADATDLAIFSAVVHANQQRPDGARIGPGSAVPIHTRHSVRVARIARALSMPDTTVRRRVVPFCGPGGLYVRTPNGLLVAPDAFQPFCTSGSSNGTKHGSIRFIIQRAIVAGLSPRHPTRSYCDGRPPSPRID